MRNSISHIFKPSLRAKSLWRPARDVDQSPELRLCLIYLVILCPVLLIAARLAYVQLVLPPRYLAELSRSRTREESIPTPNGRILSADGRVLARDVELFNLEAHYRWLEHPPNPLWLKQMARTRLNRRERRRSERVLAEQTLLLQERERLWQHVADLAELTSQHVSDQRRRIQKQVEHVRDSVQRIQRERIEKSQPDLASASLWTRLWYFVGDTLLSAAETPLEVSHAIREELEFHPLLTDIPRAMAVEIESHPETYPGLRVTRATRREYPAGELAAHVLGYRKRLDQDAITARKKQYPHGDPLDYDVGDWSGESGLEKQYETSLRGLRGRKRITLDWNGQILSEETLRLPRPGKDLELALHAELQSRIETSLSKILNPPSEEESETEGGNANERPGPNPVPRGACIAVMDVRTGELIAAASAPSFDIQLLADRDSQEWQRVSKDERHPLFPRLTRMQIPPGSVFKTLTSAALLELPDFDPDAEFYCQGYLTTPAKFRCLSFTHHGVGHESTTLTQAMAQSCNVYYFSHAPRIGRQKLSEWAERFGFGLPTGIDLPGESRGNLPRGRQLDLRGLSIGQGELLVTPLQILRMMAAIANEGSLVTPHLVRSINHLPQSIDETNASNDSRLFPRHSIDGLSPHTLDRLREALRAVVQHPNGTAHNALHMTDLPVAGKTGTAETQGKPDHAWFAGYFPADRPRYAIVTVLEHGGSGGSAAGPPTRLAIEALRDLHLLTPTRTTPPNQTTASD